MSVIMIVFTPLNLIIGITFAAAKIKEEQKFGVGSLIIGFIPLFITVPFYESVAEYDESGVLGYLLLFTPTAAGVFRITMGYIYGEQSSNSHIILTSVFFAF